MQGCNLTSAMKASGAACFALCLLGLGKTSRTADWSVNIKLFFTFKKKK